MQFPWEDNLITKIALALESWTIWTKATSLNSEGSEFDIYTQDTSASVRWTIFWVQSINNNTKINTIEWKVKIFKIDKFNDINDLIESIKNNKIEKKWNPKVSTPEENSSTDLIKNFSPPFSTNISLDNLKLNFGADDNVWITDLISFTTKAKNYISIVLEITNSESLSNLYIKDLEAKSTEEPHSKTTITLNNNSEFNLLYWEKTKKKNHSFVIKKFDTGKSNDITSLLLDENNNATVKIYLCSEKNKRLKCAWKTTFKLKNWKLVTKEREEKAELSYLPEDIANLKAKEDDNVYCGAYWEPIVTYNTAVVSNDWTNSTIINKNILCTCKPWTSLITIWKNRYCEEDAYGKKLYAFAPYDYQDINITNINSKFLKLYWENDWIPATSFFEKWAGSQISSVAKTNWVFIDNDYNDDFIKYSWLNLSNDFVIEMIVAKKWLIQDWWRYIFDTQDKWKWLYIWKSDGYFLKYNSKLLCNRNCNLNFTNSFEKIIINNKTKKLQIWWKEFNIDNINIADLFIWSRNDKTLQFNWVIDYIKIYK